MIIGITGGSGCGKTTALRVLEDMGFTCLDADKIYHELLITDTALLQELSDAFPGTVEEGTLNRKKLGAIVFSDPSALQKLNAITHPAVRREIERRLSTCENAAIDAYGLIEGNLGSLCDHTVAITADHTVRIARLTARDNITMDAAEARIHAQKSNAAYSAACEYTLTNNSTEESFRTACQTLFQALIENTPLTPSAGERRLHLAGGAVSVAD